MIKTLCPVCRAASVVLQPPPADAVSIDVPTCLGCRTDRGIVSATVRASRLGDLQPVAVPVVHRDGFFSAG